MNFGTAFTLPADHYFFVPQVELTGASDNFYWLSSAKPDCVAMGTPFTPDLQAWTRNENLDPDWLRVGTDIVGGATPPTFNGAFTLNGTRGGRDVVPLPGAGWWSGLVLLAGMCAAAWMRQRRWVRG